METISGALATRGRLVGSLTPAQGLSGALSSPSSLDGALAVSATLKGALAISGRIAGALTRLCPQIDGVLTVPAVVGVENYTGDYVVTPLAHDETVLETNGKRMLDDVTVLKVPYYVTSNTYGKTVYIASEV